MDAKAPLFSECGAKGRNLFRLAPAERRKNKAIKSLTLRWGVKPPSLPNWALKPAYFSAQLPQEKGTATPNF